jgi:hypothetical protein
MFFRTSTKSSGSFVSAVFPSVTFFALICLLFLFFLRLPLFLRSLGVARALALALALAPSFDLASALRVLHVRRSHSYPRQYPEIQFPRFAEETHASYQGIASAMLPVLQNKSRLYRLRKNSARDPVLKGRSFEPRQ